MRGRKDEAVEEGEEAGAAEGVGDDVSRADPSRPLYTYYTSFIVGVP